MLRMRLPGNGCGGSHGRGCARVRGAAQLVDIQRHETVGGEPKLLGK